MSVKVLDPVTGEIRDVDGAEAETQFRAGRVHIPKGTTVLMVDPESGESIGYVPDDKVSDALNSGLRFGTRKDEVRKEAENQPLLAAAEGFANEVVLPGMYDLPAQLMGADMEAIRARRETTPGQLGGVGGSIGGLFIPGTNALKAMGTAGKVASRVLPHTVAEMAAKGITEAADRALAKTLSEGAARSAISHGLGNAAVGAGVGALTQLDEAALGNTEASTEAILSGAGAGFLVGGALGGGLGGLLGRQAGKLDGRKVAGGVVEGEQALDSGLTADSYLASLNAQGMEADPEGTVKWFPRLLAKLSSTMTGADEQDILRVLSPGGQKAILEGEAARERAVRSVADLTDSLEENYGKMSVAEARLADSVINQIPTGAGDSAISHIASAVSEARAHLNDLIRDAANYGKTPDQMRNALKPLFTRLQQAEQRVMKEAVPSSIITPEAAEVADDLGVLGSLKAPKVPREFGGGEAVEAAAEAVRAGKKPKHMPTKITQQTSKGNYSMHPPMMDKPAIISTSRINVDDLDAGFLHGVDGVSQSDNINDAFPNRFEIRSVPQGKIVRYAEDSDLPFRNGMEELRRVATNEMDIDGTHAVNKVLGDLTRSPLPMSLREVISRAKLLGDEPPAGNIYDSAESLREWTSWFKNQAEELKGGKGDSWSYHQVKAALENIENVTKEGFWLPNILLAHGQPTIKGGAINSADELAQQVLDFYGDAVSRMPHGPAREAAERAISSMGDVKAVAKKLRKNAYNEVSTYSDEGEVLVMDQGGMKVPRDKTRIYDKGFDKAYTVDEFVKAARAGQIPIPGNPQRMNPGGEKAAELTFGKGAHIEAVSAQIVQRLEQLVGTGEEVTVAQIRQMFPFMSQPRLVQTLKHLQKKGLIDIGHMNPRHEAKILDQEKHVNDFVVSLWTPEKAATMRPPKAGTVRPMLDPLEGLAQGGPAISDKAARAAYSELDQVWRLAQGLEKKVKPILEESRGLRNMSDALRDRLQSEDIFGPAAKAHRDLTDRAAALDAARAEVEKFVPRTVNGKADRGAVERFTRSLDKVQGDERVQALANYVDAHAAYADAATSSLANLPQGALGRRLTKEFGQTYQNLRKDVLSLNAQDRLLKVSRDQGTVPLYQAGAALAGTMAGGPGVAAGMAVANTLLNPGRAARQIASLAAAKAKFAQALSARIGSIVDGTPKPTAIGAAIQIPAAVSRMIDGTPEERQAAFEEHHTEMMELAADPARYVAHVQPHLAPLAEAAPQHAQAMTAHGQKVMSYLAQEAPKPVSTLVPNPTHKFPWEKRAAAKKAAQPDPYEIRNYGQVVDVATRGAPAVLDHIERGTLRPSHVRALRTLYPHQDEDMRAQLLEKLANSKKAPSAKIRPSLELYLASGDQGDQAKTAYKQKLYADEAARVAGGAAGGAPATAVPATVIVGPLSTPTDRAQAYPYRK